MGSATFIATGAMAGGGGSATGGMVTCGGMGRGSLDRSGAGAAASVGMPAMTFSDTRMVGMALLPESDASLARSWSCLASCSL